jgi:hypothetical protein
MPCGLSKGGRSQGEGVRAVMRGGHDWGVMVVVVVGGGVVIRHEVVVRHEVVMVVVCG